jgi:predicted small metal-binding protein
MKTLSCASLGAPECHFIAKAETAEETMTAMKAHAMAEHKDKIEEMAKSMTPEQMDAMMMSKIQDEA